MRLLLDECVDRRLAGELRPHDVATVRQMGWTGVKNGRLLELAQTEFDVLVTTDRNIEHQQQLPKYGIGVLLVRAISNRVADLKPYVPQILRLAPMCKNGTITVIEREQS